MKFTEIRPGKFRAEPDEDKVLCGDIEWWMSWDDFVRCVGNARAAGKKLPWPYVEHETDLPSQPGTPIPPEEILERLAPLAKSYKDHVLADASGTLSFKLGDPTIGATGRIYVLEKFGLDALRAFWVGSDRIIACRKSLKEESVLYCFEDDTRRTWPLDDINKPWP